MQRNAPEQDQLAEQLGHLGEAEFAAFPQRYNCRATRRYRRRIGRPMPPNTNGGGCRRIAEIEAAGGTVSGHERLRSERTEPGQANQAGIVSGGPFSKRANEERGHRLVKVLRRSATAYALGEEPNEHVLDEFRALMIEK